MDLLDRMLRHDLWTTQQLLDIAATLTDDVCIIAAICCSCFADRDCQIFPKEMH
jgi:hypothetical protein